jgi:hypothetical protein
VSNAGKRWASQGRFKAARLAPISPDLVQHDERRSAGGEAPKLKKMGMQAGDKLEHTRCARVAKTPLAASEQAREGYQQAPPRSSTILGGAWPMGTIKNCALNISGFLRREANRPRRCLMPSLLSNPHLSFKPRSRPGLFLPMIFSRRHGTAPKPSGWFCVETSSSPPAWKLDDDESETKEGPPPLRCGPSSFFLRGVLAIRHVLRPCLDGKSASRSANRNA